MKDEKRLIVVLGMHRSGTSALTKGLEALGVDLRPDHFPLSPDNPKGYWEDRGFHSLNVEMLKALRHTWDEVCLLETEAILALCKGAFFDRALEMVEKFRRWSRVVGIKDPRCCLLLPFWKKVFERADLPVSYVISVRNPLSVAESLASRDACPKVKALRLWVIYNVRIISETAEACRVVVDYDKLLEDPTAQLIRVSRFLGLPVDRGALAEYVREFLDPTFCHAHFSSEGVREESACDSLVLDVWQVLRFQALAASAPNPVLWREMAVRWGRLLEMDAANAWKVESQSADTRS